MELRHLRYFVAVAEELNMRRAADRLNIAQPPLSRQIHDLEDELGVALFDRSGKKLAMTKAGEFFFQEAREILAKTKSAARLAHAASLDESGSLTIAVGAASGMLPVPILRQCKERFPEMEINVKQLNTHAQIVALLDNVVDIGFNGLGNIEFPDILCSQPIREIEALVVLPVGHPLLKKKKISLEMCSELPFITVEKASAPWVQDKYLHIFKMLGFIPNVRHRVDRAINILHLVASGAGISIVPDFFREFTLPGVAFRPLADNLPKVTFSVTWRYDNQSPLLKTFIEILRSTINKDPGRK